MNRKNRVKVEHISIDENVLEVYLISQQNERKVDTGKRWKLHTVEKSEKNYATKCHRSLFVMWPQWGFTAN